MFLNDRSEGSKNARTRPSQRLTLAGFGAAISVMSIILSFYIRPLKLVFRIVTVMGLMLPLTKGYYKESFLAYIGVIAIGVVFINIKIVSFAFIGGLYTIIAVYLDRSTEEGKIKWYYAALIRIAYATVLFWILFGVISIFFRISSLGYIWNPYATYFMVNLVFIGIFLVYDKIVIFWFDAFSKLINRISAYY